MKRFIITFYFLLVASSLSFSSTILPLNDEDKEYVKIERENGTADRERSAVDIECYIDRGSNSIELNYSGIGIPSIYIYNSNNILHDYHLLMEHNGRAILNLPSIDDTYYIIIESNTYRGIGTFIVY